MLYLVATLRLFFFNDTATTEIYTLPYTTLFRSEERALVHVADRAPELIGHDDQHERRRNDLRSEEHTSELQSLAYLVCRLLLEKKKKESTTCTTQRRSRWYKVTPTNVTPRRLAT